MSVTRRRVGRCSLPAGERGSLQRGRARRASARPGRQRGSLLLPLALLTLLLTGGAWTALRPGAVGGVPATDHTARALSVARSALLGFALAYPDRYNAVQGPGRLPCPDVDGNGSPNPPCGRAAQSSPVMGWLPERFLGLGGLRDRAGERLCYVLSPGWRNNPATRPLNSEHPGGLRLDGESDLVALLIAPGRPAGESPAPGATPGGAPCRWPVAFNAEGDALLSRRDTGDRVLALRRRELAVLMERRALAALAPALTPGPAGGVDAPGSAGAGAFPWLAPWRYPAADTARPTRASLYASRPGQHAGLLPLHLPGGWYADAAVDIDWALPAAAGARLSRPDARSPEADCLLRARCGPRVSVFADGARRELAASAAAPAFDLLCQWRHRVALDCTGHAVRQAAGQYWPAGGTAPESFDRHYVLQLRVDRAAEPEVLPPTRGRPRLRRLDTGSADQVSLQLAVHDRAPGLAGRASLLFEGRPQPGWLRVGPLRYELDPDSEGGDLPAWFVADAWHRLVYAAASPAVMPGGGGRCAPAAPEPGRRCLAVRRGAALQPVSALAIAAGPPLAQQFRGPEADIGHWFEQALAPASAGSPAGYSQERPSASHADQLRLWPAP